MTKEAPVAPWVSAQCTFLNPPLISCGDTTKLFTFGDTTK